MSLDAANMIIPDIILTPRQPSQQCVCSLLQTTTSSNTGTVWWTYELCLPSITKHLMHPTRIIQQSCYPLTCFDAHSQDSIIVVLLTVWHIIQTCQLSSLVCGFAFAVQYHFWQLVVVPHTNVHHASLLINHGRAASHPIICRCHPAQY